MKPSQAFEFIRRDMCQNDPDQITNFLGALMVMRRHPEYGSAMLEAGREWLANAELWALLEERCDRAVRSLPIEATA